MVGAGVLALVFGVGSVLAPDGDPDPDPDPEAASVISMGSGSEVVGGLWIEAVVVMVVVVVLTVPRSAGGSSWRASGEVWGEGEMEWSGRPPSRSDWWSDSGTVRVVVVATLGFLLGFLLCPFPRVGSPLSGFTERERVGRGLRLLLGLEVVLLEVVNLASFGWGGGVFSSRGPRSWRSSSPEERSSGGSSWW